MANSTRYPSFCMPVNVPFVSHVEILDWELSPSIEDFDH